MSLLSTAGPGARLLSTDLNPHCAALFEANAAAVFGNLATAATNGATPGIDGASASFHAASAEDAAALAGGFDVVVADPPRRGLGREVVARLTASASVMTVIFLSCSPSRHVLRRLHWPHCRWLQSFPAAVVREFSGNQPRGSPWHLQTYYGSRALEASVALSCTPPCRGRSAAGSILFALMMQVLHTWYN